MERLADQAGLRFDFRERVRLPDDLPAIGALEQVELVPFTEEVTGRDGPRLKGHLELTAVYAAEGDGAERTFTHRIPVNISLPVRTAPGEGAVRVEIGEFDVEAADGRSLDVSGVVTLSGLAPRQSEAAWADSGGVETAAVHRAGKAGKKKQASDEVQVIPGAEPALPADGWPISGEAPPGPAPGAGAPEQWAGPGANGEPADAGGDLPADGWPDPDALPASADPGEADEIQEDARTERRSDEPAAHVSGEAAAQLAGGPAEPASEDSAALLPEERSSESRPAAETAAAEPKVAFKPLEEAPADDLPVAGASHKAGNNNNELEWRRLFLTGEGEESFRKLRLCIVQKEETIDDIAERYRLNPREIALYNRLSDSNLSEGQILYIPPQQP